MPRGKTVARGKGVKRRRTARVTENDRTAAPSQTEHDVVLPRTQIPASNAPGPSTMSNSSVDLPNNEESVMPVYSQNINEQGTFQNFESNVNFVHEIPSISNDLGNNVSSNIRQKILNGEYIDLGCLLSNPVPIDDNSNTLIIKDGVLQSKPKASTVKINNISRWTDAFLIFIDIYLSSHLGEARGLLKYMSNIRLGASRVPGLGWKRYDEQFRLKKIRMPSCNWGTVDLELWLLFMYDDNTQNNQNHVTNVYKCYDYNNGSCTRPNCHYSHSCLRCTGIHPSVNCTRFYGAQTNFNFRRGPRFAAGQPNNSSQRGSSANPRAAVRFQRPAFHGSFNC
ncbi:unnamed protein product [Mytilus coruscus]|uniref:C3H1-type domain-containing protein n=1 Tax=Mytilus coruscus TaxID=42192 RepID=A0A6J8C1M7_MYTCO|nr:unnamed protein product [Mytilus coruscus]